MRYGQSTNDCRLAVSDQKLSVSRLLAEDESDVRRGELCIGVFSVQEEQDLAVIGDVRRNGQDDTDLLELDGRAGNCAPGRAANIRGAGVEHSDRDFLADLDRCLPVIQRHDARLGLKIGESNFLERVEEAGELELAECGREDYLERGIDYARVRIGDRRQRISAEKNSIAAEWGAAAKCVRNSVAVGIDGLERRGIRTLHELAEELVRPGAEIVRKSDVFYVRSVDEDDLGLDADLGRANVEVADVLQHVGEA